MGGAQAIFALAYGTETIAPVDVIAGPGNAWVQEAKRQVRGMVGIDSYAGPSELMVIAGHDADPEWVALDLCAQAEHGEESPLVAGRGREPRARRGRGRGRPRPRRSRPSVTDAPLALVHVPDAEAAIDLANAFAPEHLELVEEDAALLADRVTSAGCVFVGRMGATAFGDYVAGSNHVLPTGGAGRFSGPLGPGTFRRRIATVEIPAEAAAKLAPHADRIARAEGFPVHGESAMIRSPAMTRTAEKERSTAETQVRLSLDLDGGESSAAHRRRLPRPHARPARPPRPPRAARRGERRPRDRRPPHRRGRRHRPRPGPRRGARRPRRDPPLRLRPGADGRVAGRVRDRHLRAAATASSTPTCPGDLDRRLRHRADRGVLPRRRQRTRR